MPVLVPLLDPLSYDDKEVVRIALHDHGLKIYAVASASLIFRGEGRLFPALNLRGALVLSRTSTRQHSLQVLALHDVPGEIRWQHDLSSVGKLIEEKEADRDRTYTLADVDLHATCIFADDVEASKFVTKFARTARRNTLRQLTAELAQLQIDDETIRADAVRRVKYIRQDKQVPGFYDETRTASTLTVRSDPSTERAQSSYLNDLLSESNNISSQELPLSGMSLDHVACDIKVTCNIPNLTGKLDSLGEVRESEAKFSGGFGVVRPARLKNGKEVAVKTFKGMVTKESKRFRNEAVMQYLLSRESHPNVLPLWGIAEGGRYNLDISLVLPWMKNSNSFEYVKNNPDVRRLPLILGTIRGIDFLHSKGWVHGDIKARNILISDDGNPMLSDFGLTTFADVDDHDISISVIRAGSRRWMAIELHKSQTPARDVTKYSDMWAFSMTVIELLTGKRPFHELWGDSLSFTVIKHDFEEYPQRPETECPDEVWRLIRSCWNREPASRPTAAEALRVIEAIIPAPPTPSS